MNITKDFIKHCSRLYNNNHRFNDDTIIKIGIGKECSNVSVTPYNKQNKISNVSTYILINWLYNGIILKTSAMWEDILSIIHLKNQFTGEK